MFDSSGDFWTNLTTFLPLLLSAARMTIKVTIGALIVALALGLVVALLRISPFRLFRWIGLVYTDFFRGTPALVQLFIIFFGLADLGIDFDPVTAAIVGLGINGAAYVGEIYRAGIEAIHRGQLEAALSVGMTPAKAMRYIVLPQAIRIVLPPLCNYAILLVKDTAIISSIAAPEDHVRGAPSRSGDLRKQPDLLAVRAHLPGNHDSDVAPRAASGTGEGTPGNDARAPRELRA